MPNVSIIMPVYNKEKYLDESISSVLNQKYQDFELIIINDGSEDHSLEIIEKYANLDQRIKVYSIPNGGVSNARNVGLSKASGEWIWFVDADDIPAPLFLYEVFSHKKLNEVDLVIGAFSKIINDKEYPVFNKLSGIHCAATLLDNYVENQHKNGYYGYLWNKVIRRTLLLDFKIEFNCNITLAEDWYFMISVYEKSNNILFMQKKAMDYRCETEDSLSKKEIDYESQLELHIRVKRWFLEVNKAKQYESFLNENISRYAAYVVFYENEKSGNVSSITKKILDNKEVTDSLCYINENDVMSSIVRYLCKKDEKGLNRFLKCRNIIRFFYRKISKR